MLSPQVIVPSGNWTLNLEGSPINSGSIREIRSFLISCLDTAQKNVREGTGAATERSEEEERGGVFQEENYRWSLTPKKTSEGFKFWGSCGASSMGKRVRRLFARYFFFSSRLTTPGSPRILEKGEVKNENLISNKLMRFKLPSYQNFRAAAFQLLTAIEYLFHLYINLSTELPIYSSMYLSIHLCVCLLLLSSSLLFYYYYYYYYHHHHCVFLGLSGESCRCSNTPFLSDRFDPSNVYFYLLQISYSSPHRTSSESNGWEPYTSLLRSSVLDNPG